MSYAKDVLVETDWVAEHLDDDSIRIVEVDENPALYAEAPHPRRDRLRLEGRPAGPGQARLPRPRGLRRADGQPRHLQRPHRRPLRRPQQLVRRLHLLVLPLLRPRQGEAGQRPAREVDRRGPRDDAPRSRRTRRRPSPPQPGDESIRAFRDEVTAALDADDQPGRRAQPAGVLGRADRDGRLRAGGRAARRPHPRRRVGPVGAGGERGRHLQIGRRAARAVHVEGRDRRTARRSSPTAGSASARRTPGSCCTSCSARTTSRTTTAPGRSGATWSVSL